MSANRVRPTSTPESDMAPPHKYLSFCIYLLSLVVLSIHQQTIALVATMGRDKFAAMAARNAAENATASSVGEAVTPPAEEAPPVAAPAVTAVAPPPRRDKLAAMASRNAATAPAPVSAASAGGRGNKLAAMAANAPSALAAKEEQQQLQQQKNDEIQAKENYKLQIKEKLTKRRKILEQLDRAEDLTCKLLEIAHQTTKALEDLSCAPNISELSRTYRETLREIHPLLSTDTEHLVQPYQNHSMETKQSMYAARVEMRLAKERTDVLKIMTQLEKQSQEEHGVDVIEDEKSKKRQREQEV